MFFFFSICFISLPWERGKPLPLFLMKYHTIYNIKSGQERGFFFFFTHKPFLSSLFRFMKLRAWRFCK